MRLPAHIRLGSGTGGRKPPRRGWPSSPSSDCRCTGRKYSQWARGGSGSPGAGGASSRSSSAARSTRPVPRPRTSRASSVRPTQSASRSRIGDGAHRPSSRHTRASVSRSWATSASRRSTLAFRAAISPRLTVSPPRRGARRPLRAAAARAHRTAGAPSASRACRAGGELAHERPLGPRGELVQEGLDGGDVGEGVQALAVDAQLARGLRAAQHERRQQRHRLRRQAEDAAGVVRVAHHAPAARLDDEGERLEVVERGLHLGLGGLEDRVAAGLLVAARDERVERQRIGVGDGVLLFDEDAEDSGLEQR